MMRPTPFCDIFFSLFMVGTLCRRGGGAFGWAWWRFLCLARGWGGGECFLREWWNWGGNLRAKRVEGGARLGYVDPWGDEIDIFIRAEVRDGE